MMTASMCVLTYNYGTVAFLTFFITSSLQFDAFRKYMRGLIDELNDVITQRQVDHDDREVQTMLQHIVCFHVAAKE